MQKLVQGKLGEDFAVSYLKRQGFRILTRNFRIRGGEIDIIAIDKDTLVFIEVKTRTSNQFGTPLEAISYFKLKSLVKTAQFYKLQHRNLPELMRIDAVSVEIDANNQLLNIELVKSIT